MQGGVERGLVEGGDSPCACLFQAIFASSLEDGGEGLRSDAESQLAQAIQAGCDGGKQSGALGVQQQAQGADERDAQMFGGLACKGVVEDDSGAGRFEGEGEDGGFAGAEVAGERECRGADRAADFQPREVV